MTKTQQKIANRANEIQNELHNISQIGKKSNVKADYQDYVTAFLISKIASLEIALDKLRN